MDEFGVLVESIGFKSQSRSIPLSKLKSQPNKPNNQISPPPPPPPPQASSAHHQNNDFDFDFDFNKKTNQSGVMDLDAFFVGDSASAPDDIFAFNNSNGLDLLSDFANPTFKEPSPTPLSFFQSESPIDQLEAFAMNMNMNNVKISNENLGNNIFGSDDSFGPWFSKDSISRAHKSEIEDHAVLDSLFTVRNHVETKKAPSNTNHVDDFLFFEEPAPSAVEFLEIEGEPEERRRARFNQHLRTKERMAKALAEKNRRDLQAQHEQEERHSLAESMDNNIKRWAAGKVGNLRALLSSLEYVLWPECGWQPVPLTDMITSVSVKKVYHKATLCVHPDKVQQKGATVQQKYIAEKVFDLLKEAWNKFNSEELR